jgi:microcystin-dependent protein
MAEPFLGQVILFGGNFAPAGWAQCNGQLLPISQYSSLFSLLGTQFGGNGTTNFALPDLRGRAPIAFGTGPGLTNYAIGETAGQETVSLLDSESPSHSHLPNAMLAGSGVNEAGMVWAGDSNGEEQLYSSVKPATAQFALSAIGMQGGNQAHENRPPYLAVTYIISLAGSFPSRP